MGCLTLCTHSCGKQVDLELTLAPSLPSGLPVYSQLMRPLRPTCSEGAYQPGPELGKKSKLAPPIFQATRCSRSRKTNGEPCGPGLQSPWKQRHAWGPGVWSR